MYMHLKDRHYYEDMYDRHTVEWGRRDMGYFEDFYKKWFEIMPDEKPESFRSAFHLNHIYMIFVGYSLLDRYDKREDQINKMLADDKAKDEQISGARLSFEPVCQHCGKTGLRITDKSLLNRNGVDKPEEVLFMLKCSSCQKNSAFWEDGSEWEHLKTYCPKCMNVMNEKNTKSTKAIVTTYTCPKCKHSYKDKLDFTVKKEKTDPNFEQDKNIYCLQDPKILEELRDAKRRYEGLYQIFKDHQEKEDNKHIYDAMAELKKPKIVELNSILAPVLEKAGFIEFSLDKPELGKDVIVGFNCLDSKPERGDYDSQSSLKKLVVKALEDTNWRLMSDGIHYRLGYLNGRLRAYEREEDIKELVMRSRNLKPKQRSSDAANKGGPRVLKAPNGREIIL